MAIRNILKLSDDEEILRKNSREVGEITPRILTLLDDMAETMYQANGVGLAAPQVGVLRQVVVIDIGEGLIELINPKIVYAKGEVTTSEACLSVPGVSGQVTRPEKVICRALNRNGEEFEIKGEGLLARALCHETDHLKGGLFVDKVIEFDNNEKAGEEHK